MTIRDHRGALVSAGVVAKALGIHVRTIRRWVARGRLAGTCLPKGTQGRLSWFVYRDAFERLRNPQKTNPRGPADPGGA